ncbi:MAG: hypothetical protein J1E60_00235 [Christensenellaceae bacterium]|nr:hypothetical protein [Christensenellaceae bacterium]
MTLIIAFITGICPIASLAQTATVVDYTSAYSDALEYLAKGGTPSFGSVGGEWKVLALARSGYLSPEDNMFLDYYESIEGMVASVGSPMLNSSKPTENSRLILALTSIGRDARDVAGYDLTSPLSNFDYIKKQGINGAIFALLALGCRSEYSNSVIEQCLQFVLDREISGGGWSLGGGQADPDVTAMAIMAIAPYNKAQSAIGRGVQKLSEMQLDSGGYKSWGIENCESAAQVVLALSTIGIDANADKRFIKNGRSVLSALCEYRTGSGFAHIQGSGSNPMATEQAAYALCGYVRFVNGMSDLYNMNDVSFNSLPTVTASPAINNTSVPTAVPTASQTAALTNTPASFPTTAPSSVPTAVPTSVITTNPMSDSSAALTSVLDSSSVPTADLPSATATPPSVNAVIQPTITLDQANVETEKETPKTLLAFAVIGGIAGVISCIVGFVVRSKNKLSEEVKKQ